MSSRKLWDGRREVVETSSGRVEKAEQTSIEHWYGRGPRKSRESVGMAGRLGRLRESIMIAGKGWEDIERAMGGLRGWATLERTLR